MRQHAFTLNGARLVAEPEGALWWPDQQLLAVADLHLEKASAFAARGVLLPPYDSQATVARLATVVERRQPAHVVALGDSFHDGGGAARLEMPVAERLRNLVGAAARGAAELGVAREQPHGAQLAEDVLRALEEGRERLVRLEQPQP